MSAATFISYHSDSFLSTTFFIFFKTLSAVRPDVFRKSLPPFSAARYIIPKHLTKVNTFFAFFIFSFAEPLSSLLGGVSRLSITVYSTKEAGPCFARAGFSPSSSQLRYRISAALSVFHGSAITKSPAAFTFTRFVSPG